MRAFINSAALVLVGLAMLAPAAFADVYVWKDTQTGRTRMSTSPPEWLREGTPGPKVEVIRENRVIDAATAFTAPQPPAEMSERQRAAARLPERKPAALPGAAEGAAAEGLEPAK